MAVQCGDCMYYEDGRCKRYAPRPSPADADVEHPRRETTDWCGEWTDVNLDDWRTQVPVKPPRKQALEAIETAAQSIVDAISPI